MPRSSSWRANARRPIFSTVAAVPGGKTAGERGGREGRRGGREGWARGGDVGEVRARGLGEASARGDARTLDESGDGEAAEEGHESEHSVQVLRGEVRA